MGPMGLGLLRFGVLFGVLAAAGCGKVVPQTTLMCGDPKRMPPCDMAVSVDASSGDMSMVVHDLAMPDLTPPPDLGPQCHTEADCAVVAGGPGLTCIGGKCAACTQHGDCASKVCDVYQSVTVNGSSKLGACVLGSALVYVDNKNGGACTSGTGSSPTDAVCTLSAALSAVTGAKTAIRVMPSTMTYGSVTLNNINVTLYGPADQTGTSVAQLGGNLNNPAVSVTGQSVAVIDGFLIQNALNGVSCSTTQQIAITVRRSQIIGSANVGMSTLQCSPVNVDRVLFSGNKGALSMTSAPSYSVTNSFFVTNTNTVTGAIISQVNSTGTFRFNTVSANNSGSTINCGGGMPLADSIVMGNLHNGNSQFSGTCTFSNVVFGGGEPTPTATGGVALSPDFVNAAGSTAQDFKLMDDTASANCCINKAGGTIASDYFSTPRAGTADIGAHEVR